MYMSKTERRIGLVDDDDLVRYATGALLGMHQFDVEEFDSAESLLRSKSLHDFECLIIDYRMKEMTGLDLLRVLQKTNCEVPAIVVSGFMTKADVTDLIAAGAMAVLDKPVRTDELLAEVSRVARRKQAA